MTRLILTAVLLLLPIASWAAEKAEPSHDGKPLSHWLKALNEGNAASRAKAAESLGKIGPAARDAVPDLVRAVRDADEELREQAVIALGEIGDHRASAALLPLLRDADIFFVQTVGIALGKIGGMEAFAATRELLANSTPDSKGDIFRAYLRVCKERAVPHLDALLKDMDSEVRWRAAHALGRLAGTAQPAVPGLLAALRDPDKRVRCETVNALLQVDPPQMKHAISTVLQLLLNRDFNHDQAATALRPVAADAVPALVQALDYEDAEGRSAVALALARLAPTSTPHLRKSLRHERAHVRAAAALALGSLHADGREAVADLETCLADRDRTVRFQVADAMMNVDRKAAVAAVPVFIECLKEGDVGMRERSAVRLGELGGAARQAVRPLLRALDDSDGAVRLSAAVSLLDVDPREAPAVATVLIDSMQDSDVYHRRHAIRAAGRLGDVAKTAVPQLVRVLEDDNPHCRLDAAAVLVKIDKALVREVVPVLNGLMLEKKYRGSMICIYAIQAAVRLGTDARATAQALQRVMQDEDEPFRGDAAIALVKVEPDLAKVGIEFLKKALQGGDGEPQEEAFEHVAELGPAGKPLVPVLTKLLGDRQPYLRRRAAEVLGEMGLVAQEAVPALKRASEERDANVREAVGDALKMIADAQSKQSAK